MSVEADEYALRLRSLERLRELLANARQPETLLEDETFVALIDTLVPSGDLIKRYLLARENRGNPNYAASGQINAIRSRIDAICAHHGRIALYGNGVVTETFRPFFGDRIVQVADRNPRPGCSLPEALDPDAFDCIVIMVLGREKEIREFLVDACGIPAEKIVEFRL